MGDLWDRLFGRTPRDDNVAADHAEEVDKLAERGDRERERACQAVSAWDRDEVVIRDGMRGRAGVTETLLRARREADRRAAESQGMEASPGGRGG